MDRKRGGQAGRALATENLPVGCFQATSFDFFFSDNNQIRPEGRTGRSSAIGPCEHMNRLASRRQACWEDFLKRNRFFCFIVAIVLGQIHFNNRSLGPGSDRNQICTGKDSFI
ncbi:hypothetical protein F2P81_018129 [Scophthalmus maximus]|uniref:Uncharacterized protein n=1 Tax=Scophthalmus maximus TaxID=52904 RepID=A0A6A4SDP5_SCOMX|nr:hypothetical protein F2P81_018129 [Scophthalmus maximus]